MEKIYYDRRTGEWKRNLDITYLAPEMYFEVKESEDDKDHHIFETDNGNVEFSSDPGDLDSFEKVYIPLEQKNKYLRRKEWRVSKKNWNSACKLYKL